ncbi:MAG: acyltransferase [Okeania sp. SIO2C2]|uniref:acyltransferase n=1 Tax=Okeania sp. SIO2C2 TaxID=2607787 RepID=UPI0013BBCB25|nr:acyltransferase [Okeania sp. SIO2C2]NEP85839.1 acyltransferase [Okeania sp. SIO2C2]
MIEVLNKGLSNKILIDSEVELNSNAQIIICGNNNYLEICKNVKINKSIVEINGNKSSIIIRKNCILGGEFRCLNDSTSISIGENTTMMRVRIFLHESGKISIGDDCMFSGDIYMNVSDVHSILDLESGKRINPPENIEIGSHVCICQGCTILKGVTIGSNSVIGAKSLVSNNVPQNTIVAGVPAKIVKENITWDRKRLPFN